MSEPDWADEEALGALGNGLMPSHVYGRVAQALRAERAATWELAYNQGVFDTANDLQAKHEEEIEALKTDLESYMRIANTEATEAEALRAKHEAEVAGLKESVKDLLGSLVAAVSLLKRGGKKAAPSDKMFSMMLVDYNNSIERARRRLWKDKSDG